MPFKLITLLSLSFLFFNSIQGRNICNFTISLHRNLTDAGFHRTLEFFIHIKRLPLRKGNKAEQKKFLYENCTFALQQPLPAGIYVDPDELKELRRRRKLSVFSHNVMNVEVPAPYAQPFNTYILTSVNSSRMTTFLPLHLRYQSPAEGGGSVTNEIDVPSFYIRCPDNRLDRCDWPVKTKTYLCDIMSLSANECFWREFPLTPNPNGTLSWKIPVGNLDHSLLVDTVTMLVVVLSSLAIILKIHQHRMSYSGRKNKT